MELDTCPTRACARVPKRVYLRLDSRPAVWYPVSVTGALIFIILYFVCLFGSGYFVVKTANSRNKPKQIKPRKEWYVQVRDHPKKPNFYVVQLKRGGNYMYVQELDLRADDFDDQLAAAVSRAEDRANAVNSQERLLNA